MLQVRKCSSSPTSSSVLISPASSGIPCHWATSGKGTLLLPFIHTMYISIMSPLVHLSGLKSPNVTAFPCREAPLGLLYLYLTPSEVQQPQPHTVFQMCCTRDPCKGIVTLASRSAAISYPSWGGEMRGGFSDSRCTLNQHLH